MPEAVSNKNKGIDWTKWGVIVAVVGIAATIFFQQPSIKTSNSTNSPVIQGSSNVSVSYISYTGDNPAGLLSRSISFSMDPLVRGSSYDFFSVEMVLPDKEILFLPQVLHGEQYKIFDTDANASQFSINQPYKITESFDPQKSCFIATFPKTSSLDLSFTRGPGFSKTCYRLISGPDVISQIWGS